MEAFQGVKWRDNGPFGYRRGGFHGNTGDRDALNSFNSHPPRPYNVDGNWMRNSERDSPVLANDNGSWPPPASHSPTAQVPPNCSPHYHNDIGPITENGYPNQWRPPGNGQIYHQYPQSMRIERFPPHSPRGGGGGGNRRRHRRRGRGGLRYHHGNGGPRHSPSPHNMSPVHHMNMDLSYAGTPPDSVPSPLLPSPRFATPMPRHQHHINQNTNQPIVVPLDPIHDHHSPFSIENSDVNYDLRDPRMQKPRNVSGTLPALFSRSPPPDHEYCGTNYSRQFRPNHTSSPIPHGITSNSIPPSHSLHLDNTSSPPMFQQCYGHEIRDPQSHCSEKHQNATHHRMFSTASHDEPPVNGMDLSRMGRIAMTQRIDFEHPYCYNADQHRGRSHTRQFLSNENHSILMTCNTSDIPLPALETAALKYCDTGTRSTEECNLVEPLLSESKCPKIEQENDLETITKNTILKTTVSKELNVLFVKMSAENPKNTKTEDCFLSSCPTSKTSDVAVSQSSSVLKDDNGCETTTTATFKNHKNRHESLSSLSLEFSLDLDTEMESSMSSSSLGLSDDESQRQHLQQQKQLYCDTLKSPLPISYPLSRISLPTSVLLKPTAEKPTKVKESDSSSPKPQLMVDRLHGSNSYVRIDSKVPDTIQLRNRALPRNLYLYASRKAPVTPSVRAKDKPTKPSDVIVDISEDKADESMSLFLNSSGSDDSLMVSVDDSSNTSQDYVTFTNDCIKKPGINNVMLDAKLSPKSCQMSPDKPKKKKNTFQDFVPVILKSRSRAETRTIQRQKKMAVAIQKNGSEIMTFVQTELEGEEEEERISPYKMRRHVRRERPTSPSLHNIDDSSSLVSESLSFGGSESVDDFSPEIVRRYKNILSQTKTKSGCGDSPLHHICRNGKYDLLCYVLHKELHGINVQDNAGWTPLHEACNNGHKDIVELLLAHGADPNIAASDGTRPIHDAVEGGHFEIVMILVNHKADPTIEHSERTPLEIAKSCEFHEIADYLSVVCEKWKLAKQTAQQKQLQLVQRVSPTNTDCNKPINSVCSSTDVDIRLPLDGYRDPLLGPELDTPVFYVSAIIETSNVPMLPVYNIIVSEGTNPRRHNFHILDDILKHFNIDRETLLQSLDVKTYSISLNDLTRQVANNDITKHSNLIQRLLDTNSNLSTVLEMIPVCNQLRDILSIQVENIDD